ncbi:uncharacterized protein LOC131929665 [Physella acuta]|uniref:uncharacterized protein LOC131929665 n=1 Tax=Physella acuta TaxID=109671 RepID=UPI0027DB89CB|nr:uncharacterized protein LOC131929665 [Physella acuta]XP_059141968.1 uncharacterized protein LOC131929665 [Physella acuta]XP_059141969.1 uncharacterized protein LOC131929665 [Physella acuta]
MTSQKRYRHHQENNGSRFRDLPPRFKRQKSSSSPPPKPTASPDASNCQENSVPQRLTPDLPAVTSASTSISMAPSPSFVKSCVNQDMYLPKDFLPAKTPLSVNSTAQWSMAQKKDLQPVLSPVDNRYLKYSSNLQSPSHIPLGTNFGYSPPMSPWSAGSSSSFSGQPNDMLLQNSWSPSPVYSGQRLQSPPALNYNNENFAPIGSLMPPQLSPVSTWAKPSYSPHAVSASPPAHCLPAASPSGIAKDKPKQSIDENRNGGKPDYSDPDIRTIEMLRELERVADEKDNDDFCVDRKSLVSHHLRMLMCAVDRYTEGVEDEVTPRGDEASLASESPVSSPRRSSPAPVKMWPHEQSKAVSECSVVETATWHQNSPSVWGSEISKVSTPLVNSSEKKMESQRKTPPPEPSAIWGSSDKIEHQDYSPAWDLWSSPSFDICRGILSKPCELDKADSPFFDTFSYARGDNLATEGYKERKPLYKR